MIQGTKSLDGKTAIVTGSGRGIGRAIAESLHSQGAQVVIADIHADNARDTADGLGSGALAVPTDVSSSDAVSRMIEAALDEFGGIDILVNNAGADKAVPILEMEEAEWDRLMNINLKSVFLCTKAALPSMIERGGGSVISTSSIVARQGAMNGGIHYASTKGAIIGFTKTLARQMADHNIRANCIAPGVIDTDLIREHMPDEMRTSIEGSIPAKRLGQTAEIGSVVSFLASDAASYINGATIDINGGFWIG